MHPTTTLLLLALSVVFTSSFNVVADELEPGRAPAKYIVWQSSWEQALQGAQTDERIVFLAVNMDGERANDRMAEDVYTEKSIVALSQHTSNAIASVSQHAAAGKKCPRFDGIACEVHRSVDMAVREKLLKPDSQGRVVAPQHVFVDRDGQVILSVPYEITTRELEWCFVTALERAGVEVPANAPRGGRAPRRVIFGDVYDTGDEAAPLTREEALELIDQVKRGMRGEERRNAVRKILTVDDPEAIKFIQGELAGIYGGGRGGRRGGGGANGRDPDEIKATLIHQIGVHSPASYWVVVAEYSDSDKVLIRNEVAVALEQLAAPESQKVIRTALKKEKQAGVEANWLRALGSAGSQDKRSRKTLLKPAKSEKNITLRANAILALGYSEPDEDVQSLLATALADGVPEEQLAAACALGVARDVSGREGLEAVMNSNESSEALKTACKSALAVIEGAELKELRESIRLCSGDSIPRERIFGD